MSNFEICNFEEFVADATPQVASMEEAASAQEILIQQLEGYLSRLKAALCTDVLTLEAQIAAGGGGNGGTAEPWKISERQLIVTQALGGSPSVPLDFETAGINDAPGELTWDAVAFAWENTSSATLFCNLMTSISCQNVAASGRPIFRYQINTGAGFVDVPGSFFWTEGGRMDTGQNWRLDLEPGDKIAVAGHAIVGSVNMIGGSTFQILSRTTAV